MIRNSNQLIDYKILINLILKNWIVFIITITIALSAGYAYIRYTEKIHTAYITIKINDGNNSQISSENLLDEIKLFNIEKNLVNEINILKSINLLTDVITQQKTFIEYYIEGDIKFTEIYNEIPYTLILDDSCKFPSENIKLQINEIDENNFKINNQGDQHKFGVKFKYKNIKIALTKNHNFNINPNNKYFIYIKNPEQLAIKYSFRLKIAPVDKGASILKIISSGTIIDKEIDLLNKLAYEFVMRDLREKNRIADNTVQFINTELDQIVESLSGTEGELVNFRSKNKVMNLETSSERIFIKLDNLNQTLASLIIKDKYYKYLLGYISAQNTLDDLVAPSTMGINEPLLIELISQLNNLYKDRAALKSNLKGINPTIVDIEKRIQNLKDNLKENINNINISSQITIKNIKDQISAVEVMVNELPTQERNLVNIERKFNLNNHLYNYLIEKRAEIGIAKSAHTPDNQIIDTARRDQTFEIKPTKKQVYIAAILFGLLLPLIILVTLNLLSDKINNTQDIKNNISVPIIGTILHNNDNNIDSIIKSPKSAISESIREIRSNLNYILNNDSNGGKVIGFTSTTSTEGKTFSTINLGFILSFSNKKVIIINADLRKPRLGSELGIDEKQIKGLSTYLSSQTNLEDIIIPNVYDLIDIIPSGPIPPNPSELLANEQTAELFKILRKKYDYILVDSPPTGLVSDFLTIKNHTDINMFIIRSGFSKIEMVKNTLSENFTNQVKNIYIILNDKKSSKFNYGYGYGYGYYEENQSKNKNILTKLFNKFKKS